MSTPTPDTSGNKELADQFVSELDIHTVLAALSLSRTGKLDLEALSSASGIPWGELEAVLSEVLANRTPVLGWIDGRDLGESLAAFMEDPAGS